MAYYRLIIWVFPHSNGYTILKNKVELEPYTELNWSPCAISLYQANTHSMHAQSGDAGFVCKTTKLLPVRGCFEGHFLCNNSECIIEHHLCDGHLTCQDGSDESHCPAVCYISGLSLSDLPFCSFHCTSPDCTCELMYFQCYIGGCIPLSRYCDVHSDCLDRLMKHIVILPRLYTKLMTPWIEHQR